MTDTLRTRIAAAIYNASDEYTRKLMVRPDCPGASELEGDGKPVCYVLADAVIRELGQRRCERCRQPFRDELVAFAVWLLQEEPGEGHEEKLVDTYLAGLRPHLPTGAGR